MKQIVTYSYTFYFFFFLSSCVVTFKFGNYFSSRHYLCLPIKVCMTDERNQDILKFFPHFLYLVCDKK